MTGSNPSVLLALSPIVEQSLAPLLFGEQAAVRVAASLVELAALERTLASGTEAEALLVSADLPDLTPSLVSRARSRGLRLVGIAIDTDDAALLRELPLDAVLVAPMDGLALRVALNSATREINNGDREVILTAEAHRQDRAGTVLAVVGSRGAPGASELACSLAALAAAEWQALLVELDLLGNAGLALRLGSDPTQGSLLALLRATRSGEGALAELLDRWLVNREGWPPVLLAPPEVREAIDELDQPGSIRTALDALGNQYQLVIADIGFLLSQPGIVAPVERCQREALVAADAVLLTVGAREAQLDAGLAQLDVLLDELEIPRERIRVVCNGIGGPGAIPRSQLEQTLTVGLREREIAADALLPWDGRALAKAVQTGLPLTGAHPRGDYAQALARLLETLFLPGTPVARTRKRLFSLPLPLSVQHESVPERGEEEVVLPWRS